MLLNAHLARKIGETGVTLILDNLDQRFQALLQRLENDGVCQRGEDCPPIITKEQWLQAQLVTIQKMAKGEKL
jgi:hypothetical protein